MTGLIGGDVTITMAAVMFGVISVAGLLLLSLSRSLRAVPAAGDDVAGSDTGDAVEDAQADELVVVSDVSELGVVAAAEAVVEAARATGRTSPPRPAPRRGRTPVGWAPCFL